jgi:RNA polymerase sigma factor FliA
VDTQALWHSYRAHPEERALRDRLILTYAPLVKYVAGRLGSGLPAHVEQEDLVSYGLLGLIAAVERYDPDRDVKFETYAMTRIRGAILDELRSLDWVPRSVRARAREIERAIAALEARLHRPPTDEEIARQVGITVDELESSLTDISRSSIAALDELWTMSDGDDQVALIDTLEDADAPAPESSLVATETREALRAAVERLPEPEQRVVTLYYYDELKLREIGEVLGVTESRVSQLHTKAVLRLKAGLAEGPRDPTDVERYDEELAKVTIGGAQPLTQPIEISDYDPNWPRLYEQEEARIRSILGDRVIRIDHVGSTSVPGLPAKPIIDIVLEVPESADEQAYVPAMEAAGYALRIREPEWFEHRLFKGPDTNVNLHVFSAGCAEVDRMLLFRDWLRTSAADRERYADAKRELAAREWKYTQQYADAKTEVVHEIMARAQAAS